MGWCSTASARPPPDATVRVTRRDLALAALAAGLAPALIAAPASAEPLVPLIIAEGGAAEERIEDTHPALDLAIDQGCDFLQVTLVPTSEGSLVARRDNELSATTDVAAHPEFAPRKTTKTIDGKPVDGWFAEDFTLAELKTLTCRERLPQLRPQTRRYEGKEPILTLPEVLAIARAGCVRTARTVGVCVRLIHARYFADQNLPVETRLASELAIEGYASSAAAIWMQASEPETLRAFGRISPVRRMRLLDADDPAATTTDALTATKAFAEAIAPDQDLVLDPAAATFPAPTTLALDAHHAGLQVFSRTARAENAFLPPALRRGDPRADNFPAQHGDVDKLMVALFANGVDGLATDLPAQAVRARSAAIGALRRQSRGG